MHQEVAVLAIFLPTHGPREGPAAGGRVADAAVVPTVSFLRSGSQLVGCHLCSSKLETPLTDMPSVCFHGDLISMQMVGYTFQFL